jgi:hypothetical protein
MGGVVAVAVGGAAVWVAAVGAPLQVFPSPCFVLLWVAFFAFFPLALAFLAQPCVTLPSQIAQIALSHILCSLCADYSLTCFVAELPLPRSYVLNLSSLTSATLLF